MFTGTHKELGDTKPRIPSKVTWGQHRTQGPQKEVPSCKGEVEAGLPQLPSQQLVGKTLLKGPGYLQLSRKPAVPGGIVEVQIIEEHAL